SFTSAARGVVCRVVRASTKARPLAGIPNRSLMTSPWNDSPLREHRLFMSARRYTSMKATCNVTHPGIQAMKLSGRKTLITGAASGIGRSIASRFLEEGAEVAGIDIDAARLDATVQALQGRGRKILGFTADLGIAAQAADAAERA